MAGDAKSASSARTDSGWVDVAASPAENAVVFWMAGSTAGTMPGSGGSLSKRAVQTLNHLDRLCSQRLARLLRAGGHHPQLLLAMNCKASPGLST